MIVHDYVQQVKRKTPGVYNLEQVRANFLVQGPHWDFELARRAGPVAVWDVSRKHNSEKHRM